MKPIGSLLFLLTINANSYYSDVYICVMPHHKTNRTNPTLDKKLTEIDRKKLAELKHLAKFVIY